MNRSAGAANITAKTEAAARFLGRCEHHAVRHELAETRALLHRYLLPRFGPSPVEEVTPEALEAYGQQLRFRLSRESQSVAEHEVAAVLRLARKVLSTAQVAMPRAFSLEARPVAPEKLCLLWSAMPLRWRLYGRLRLVAGLTHAEAGDACWSDFSPDLRLFGGVRVIEASLATQLLYAQAMSDEPALFPDLMGLDEGRFEAEAWLPALKALGEPARGVGFLPDSFAAAALARGEALEDVADAIGMGAEDFAARFQAWLPSGLLAARRRPTLQPV